MVEACKSLKRQMHAKLFEMLNLFSSSGNLSKGRGTSFLAGAAVGRAGCTFISSSPRVINHLHRSPPRLGIGKGPGDITVERFPSLRINLSLVRGLETLVRIILAEEGGLAHEEALTVVVAIDEPAGNVVGLVAADLAGGGVEHG